jgi:predicted acylesterase/phospholipase RssA
MLPRTLVFSGGGSRCLLFLPALIELQKRGRLIKVEECWGTSAGALLASLYVINRDAQKIHSLMFKTDLSKFRDIDITNLLSIHQTWGLDDGKQLTMTIETMLEDSKQKTMAEVPGINIVVCDLTAKKTIVLNSKTYPELRLVDAIRASMSVPFFLRPYTASNGHLWVDGALRYNFPWQLLPNDTERRSALGFAFKKEISDYPKTITQYIFSVLNFNEPERVSSSDWSNIVWFERPDFPAWFVKFKDEDYTMITEQSIKTIEDWIKSERSIGSMNPLRNSGSLLPSSGHYIPSQVSPPHCKVELSDSQKPFREPIQDSSPPQSPYKPLSYRRWSV